MKKLIEKFVQSGTGQLNVLLIMSESNSAPSKNFTVEPHDSRNPNILYRLYKGEEEIKEIFELIDNELSEPYGLFTYRYFTAVCPQHCLVAVDTERDNKIIGAIVGRETAKGDTVKGYIAMLVVLNDYRKKGIGKQLAVQVINIMKQTCNQIVLETEVTNTGALYLYESLGFVRTKRLYRYYLNGNEAYRLKIWF
ncbi:acetyltransferase, GNAT family protein [Tritrichomonas foetus]|uniref:Acetyltransferase, GNAT family protein n=1 Tax=Tritrichomonas foetus TaxID=1144522 RepID=A0A1J4JDT6_9EUKA|nr:acetyltransferase, GNAT family protein [Tritrichomonas foetus]|eukprot:OHS97358.1 acetyltransferase, GNAT family protein [Tritrichomonas foetus]